MARSSSHLTPSAAATRCPAWRRPPGRWGALAGFTRWNAADPKRRWSIGLSSIPRRPRDALIEGRGTRRGAALLQDSSAALSASAAGVRCSNSRVDDRRRGALCRRNVRYQGPRAVYSRLLEEARLRTVTVDPRTSGRPSARASREVARHHPRRARRVHDDRGSGVQRQWLPPLSSRTGHVGGLISGAGRAAPRWPPPPCAACPSACPSHVFDRGLGRREPSVGPSDIMMMYS